MAASRLGCTARPGRHHDAPLLRGQAGLAAPATQQLTALAAASYVIGEICGSSLSLPFLLGAFARGRFLWPDENNGAGYF